jgi:hypothetical protein
VKKSKLTSRVSFQSCHRNRIEPPEPAVSALAAVFRFAHASSRTLHTLLGQRCFVFCLQSPITMRLCTGVSCAEFTLLARLRATGRATDSLYLFESRLLGFHVCGLCGNPHEEKWSISHRLKEILRELPPDPIRTRRAAYLPREWGRVQTRLTGLPARPVDPQSVRPFHPGRAPGAGSPHPRINWPPSLRRLSYSRRKRRILGDKFTSRHFGHGHLKAVSFGKTMWPHFSQICRPLERTLIGLNPVSTTQ